MYICYNLHSKVNTPHYCTARICSALMRYDLCKYTWLYVFSCFFKVCISFVHGPLSVTLTECSIKDLNISCLWWRPFLSFSQQFVTSGIYCNFSTGRDLNVLAEEVLCLQVWAALKCSALVEQTLTVVTSTCIRNHFGSWIKIWRIWTTPHS